MDFLKRPSFRHFVLVLGGLAGLLWPMSFVVLAQPPNNQPLLGGLNAISWQEGPCTAKVGNNLAQVKVPQGYKFTGLEGTRKFLELTQNSPTPRDMGILCPSTWPGLNDWFLVFEWDAVGYVKDDEKNNLDGNAILESMKNGQEADNQARKAKGWPMLELIGWEKAPFYDPQSNNLVWATRIRDKGGPGLPMETINYNSRILGRGGVMSANLIIAPNIMDKELPNYNKILADFSFLPGQKYSEWRSGDKVAAYGLTALVAGGAAALAAKSGLLAKFAKVIIAGGVAVVAGIGALFKKMFGRGSDNA